MKPKFLHIIFFFLIFIGLESVNAQDSDTRATDYHGISNIFNAKDPEKIGIRTNIQKAKDQKNALAYPFVDDEKDVLWSKIIWEVIDLDERVNFPLLYPIDTNVVGRERRPMFWWLRQAIEDKSNPLPIYVDKSKMYDDIGEFTKWTRISDKEIEDIFKRKVITKEGNNKKSDYITILDSHITDLTDNFNFNPYEKDEEVEIDPENLLKYENDTIYSKVFPHTITEYNQFSEFTSDQFTYSMYDGLVNGGVRIILPDGEAQPLTQDEKIEYAAVMEQIIESYFFEEDIDYYWKNLELSDVERWLLKGIWYFDKKYSELIYRPIGIAPVVYEEPEGDTGEDDESSTDDEVKNINNYIPPAVNGVDSDGDGVSDIDETENWGTDPQLADTDGDGFNDADELFKWDTDWDNAEDFPSEDDIDRFNNPEKYVQNKPEEEEEEEEEVQKSYYDDHKIKFWVYYPHARKILTQGKAFNPRNVSQSISFDDIINERRFNGVIYKEQNVYENRDIKSYIQDNSFMRLLESERIKESIRNFEHDMWSW